MDPSGVYNKDPVEKQIKDREVVGKVSLLQLVIYSLDDFINSVTSSTSRNVLFTYSSGLPFLHSHFHNTHTSISTLRWIPFYT